jgi:uncharacterized protein YceH (UPF0502 family)
MDEPESIDDSPVTQLSKPQRRVLGVLLEKSSTTPEYYPMTLKAITAGCNQKSNRHPLVDYSEDDVAEALEQLRRIGLVAIVHTESGRTERFRHYARKRFTMSEPQLAIMTELLLRGRQSLGELRTRASRMVPIESLDQLRTELEGLLSMNLLQSTGALERRGTEVDHNLYEPKENRKLAVGADEHPMRSSASERPTATGDAPPDRAAAGFERQPAREERSTPPSAAPTVPSSTISGAATASTGESPAIAALQRAVSELQQENRSSRERLEALSDAVEQMGRQIAELRDALGG